MKRISYTSKIEKNNLEEDGFDKFSINKIFSEKSLESLKYLRENFNKLNLHDENQKKFP